MKTTIVSTVAAFSLLCVTPALAQESSRKDFEDFCTDWQGRWVGDVTLDVDDQGFGEKADKLTGHAICRTIEDGNAMLVNVYIGEGSGTWLVTYDANAKRIRTVWCTSGGIVNQSIMYKSEDGWIQEGSGSDRDGKKREFKDHIIVGDGGKKHTWTGTMTVDGKAVKVTPDVWQKTSQLP